MRISTSWGQQTAISSILDQQSQLQQTQTAVSTGKKVIAPSDGPAATVSINNLNQSISQTQQYQTNSNVAQQRLSLEDSTLQGSTTILQQINELCLQGMNATTNASDKATIANQIQGLNQQLLSLANTQNVNGEYLFSGTNNTTPPFAQDPGNPGAYDYAGNSAQRTIQVGASTHVTDGDSGNAVFGTPTGPIGTLPAPGSATNIFEAINQFAAALTANTVTGSAPAFGAIAANTFQINGTNIGAVTAGTGAITQGANVAAAINLLTATTGVTATANTTTGAITLTNTTGAAIAITGTTTNTGLTAATANNNINISALQASLGDITKGANRILAVDATVGSRLNTLTTQNTINSGAVLNMQTALSSVQDVNEASAISTLNLQTVALQASQQAYSQVNKLSLFNYI
jgi:flagellar hook-associated protein 3 FlgL